LRKRWKGVHWGWYGDRHWNLYLLLCLFPRFFVVFLSIALLRRDPQRMSASSCPNNASITSFSRILVKIERKTCKKVDNGTVLWLRFASKRPYWLIQSFLMRWGSCFWLKFNPFVWWWGVWWWEYVLLRLVGRGVVGTDCWVEIWSWW
jgi:hypothetical protein